MILSNQEIIQRSTSGALPLLSPMIIENVRGGSYDLTVGDEIYLGKDGKNSVLETIKLKPKQSFEIAAHEICFILTEEQIQLSNDIAAKISLRMTHIYRGLILTSQPPFDPGYTGKAIVMVHNLSSQSIHLKRGERIASIEFFLLNNASTTSLVHQSVNQLQAQLNTPVTSSLMNIHYTAQNAKKNVRWLTGASATILTILISALGLSSIYSNINMNSRVDANETLATATKGSIDKHSKTIRKVQSELDKQAENIKRMQLEIDSQKSEIALYKSQIETLKQAANTTKPSSSNTP